jgi:hypothetical protein
MCSACVPPTATLTSANAHVYRLPKFKHVVEQWGGPVSVAVYIEFPSTSSEAQRCRDAVRHFVDTLLLGPLQKSGAAQPFVLTFLHARKVAAGAECDLPAPPKVSFWGRKLSQLVSGGLRAAERIPASGQHSGEAWRSSPAGRLGRLAHFVSNPAPQQLSGTVVQPSAAHQAAAGSFWKMRPGTKQNVLFTKRPWADVYAEQYPVNALRNAAWRQVRTDVSASRCLRWQSPWLLRRGPGVESVSRATVGWRGGIFHPPVQSSPDCGRSQQPSVTRRAARRCRRASLCSSTT